MGKRGPKPKPIDPKLLDFFKSKKRHGIYLYALGCRCDVCRKMKAEIAKKARHGLVSMRPPKEKKKEQVLYCDREVKGLLPFGNQMLFDLRGQRVS